MLPVQSASWSWGGEWARDPAAQAHIAQLNSELDPHEQLQRVVVMSDEWTVENGLLTPTMKLKRSAIETKYAPHVTTWVEEREEVLWA